MTGPDDNRTVVAKFVTFCQLALLAWAISVTTAIAILGRNFTQAASRDMVDWAGGRWTWVGMYTLAALLLVGGLAFHRAAWRIAATIVIAAGNLLVAIMGITEDDWGVWFSQILGVVTICILAAIDWTVDQCKRDGP